MNGPFEIRRFTARSLRLVSLLVVCCIGQSVPAQERLTQVLMRENIDDLAAAARQRGDAVRGAVLFAQKKLGCVGCHAENASNLVGPDLTTIDKNTTDRHFVESILMPSKTVSKGFLSHQILTSEGKTIVGRIISESDTELVIRDAQRPDRTIRLPVDQVEQKAVQEKSAMPDGLADQLSDRQQFLDLVKYVIEIVRTSNQDSRNMDASDTGLAAADVLDRSVQGLALMDHFNCVRCHDGLSRGFDFPNRSAPDLASVGSRISPHYIARFVAAPHEVKHGTSMPNMLAKMSPDERDVSAQALTHYLVSLTDKAFEPKAVDPEAAERGEIAFHSVGCVACHSPRGDDGEEKHRSETDSDLSVPLGDLSGKYSPETLASFLENPHRARPSGRMPNMKLTHWEALDIGHYLAGAKPNGFAEFQVDPDQAKVGQNLFQKFQCVRCHSGPKGSRGAVNSSVPITSSAGGCLSEKAGSWPRYELSDQQRALLVDAIESSRNRLGDEQRVQLSMTTFRCYNCHQRNGIGGVTTARNDYFQTTDPNLGPQGRIPPSLTGVGNKLQPKWLRQVLVSGRSIRPYVKTRMPQYGAVQVGHLVDLFGRADPAPDVHFGTADDPKETKKTATELVGNRGLNCVACHTFQQKPAQTMPGVDLTEMGQRLQKNWFYRYMKSPQTLNPGTVMPSFWPGGKSIRPEILGGDRDTQIEAIWLYLQDGRQARTPRGLNIEPIELLSQNGRAVMLRRKYPHIGKRGIGVGYPHQVNLAFDAEQMRLGLMWRGEFADPGGVWRSQGHGQVRPLSREVMRFAYGPDFDSATSPWEVDDGRPEKHRFRGYHLDENDRPIFRYEFGNVAVEDFFVEVPGDRSADSGTRNSSLRRTIKFRAMAQSKGLAFRVASGEKVRRSDDGSFVVGPTLRVRIDGEHETKITESVMERPKDSEMVLGQQALVLLDLPAGNSELVIHYNW